MAIAATEPMGPDIHSAPVLAYRWVTFALAAGFTAYQLITSDYSSPGGPFRFLTIWALLFSFYAASRMLALSQRRITTRHETTAMATAVLNAMVVVLYWKLYFEDPSQVNLSDEIVWHQEYYLHALGPALQIFDALFIGRVWRRIWRGGVALCAVVPGYVAWVELFVAPFNNIPAGSVTSGLPYPFLNNLEWADRALFYASNGAAALVLLVVFAAVGRGVDRAFPVRQG